MSDATIRLGKVHALGLRKGTLFVYCGRLLTDDLTVTDTLHRDRVTCDKCKVALVKVTS